MDSQKQTYVDSSAKEGVSLKVLILTIREWIAYLLSKWLIILIVGLIGGALGFIIALNKKPRYKGELTFVLEETKSGGLGAYSGLASQFGIDLGGGGGMGVFSGDNIVEFLKSRLMVEKTLLSPVQYNGKTTTLVDFYIDYNEIRKDWGHLPAMKDLRFPVGANREKFSLQQDSILGMIYQTLVKENLVVEKPDKKLSFVSVVCTTESEAFCKMFIERLVDEAARFYIETKTKRSKAIVDKQQAQVDSIERLLNRQTYSAAKIQDLNMNPVRKIASISGEVALRDKMVLQTMYGEVLKNLEISKMTLSQETPMIQIIDKPILPLKKDKLGKAKGIILGGILAGVLICSLLIIIEVYRRIVR